MVFHSFLEASALLNPWVRPRPGLTSPPARREAAYRSLLASRSDSRRVRISPSLTGPFTLRMMRRFWSSRNLTRTWVTCPRDPVLPMTLTTIASFRGDSCGCDASRKKKEYESLRQRAGSSEKKVAQGAQSEAARGKQVRRPQRRSASRIARARCRHGTVWSFPSLCPTPDPQDLGGLEDGERKNRWVPRLPLEAIAPRSAASSAILASHYVHLTPPSGGTGFLTMVTVGFARPALVLQCTACLRFGFGPSLSFGQRGGRRRCRNRVLETRKPGENRTSHFNGSRMDSSLRNVQRKCLRRGGGGGGGEAGEHRSKIAPFRRTHCCEARRPPTGRDHFYDNSRILDSGRAVHTGGKTTEPSRPHSPFSRFPKSRSSRRG